MLFQSAGIDPTRPGNTETGEFMTTTLRFKANTKVMKCLK